MVKRAPVNQRPVHSSLAPHHPTNPGNNFAARARHRTVRKNPQLSESGSHGGPPLHRSLKCSLLVVALTNAAVKDAAKKAGLEVKSPFTPGRTDAAPEQTDVASFAALEPTADAFRNYYAHGNARSPAELLVERAEMLTLTVPEMTVLVGGLRVLDANVGHVAHGVLTGRPGTLSNDFFVNLLDVSTAWKKTDKAEAVYEGHDRKTGAVKWTATPVDLVFGSNSELRAVAEVYASDDAKEMFTRDFVKAWTKVMNLDRFDAKR